MEDITVRDKNNLPATREELAQFVLVGREALNAVRAKIRAIDKAGLAKDVYEQKLAEGQDVAEAVLDAEVRLGELFSEIPANITGRPSKSSANEGTTLQTKEQVIEGSGFKKRAAYKLEEMSNNPEAVERAKEKARKDNKLVSRADVEREIKDQKRKEELERIHEDNFDGTKTNNHNVKRGDVWILGNHRLMCGDATNFDDVAKLMDGAKADMVFTDPPYGVHYQSNFRVATDKFDELANDDKILDFMPIVNNFCNGFIFICSSWKVIDLWAKVFKQTNNLTNLIIWDKCVGGMGDLNKTFNTDYELILCDNNGKQLTGSRIGSIWSIPRDCVNNYIHSTQKPIQLPATAIKHTTNENDTVLDMFAGSGSTLMACEKTNRVCCAMELDTNYCESIISRFEQSTGIKAQKEE